MIVSTMLVNIPAPPQSQALQSKTFRPPPLDGSLTLSQIYDWHYKHTPDHRLFIFADDDNNIRSIHWPEGVRAIYNGVRYLQSNTDLKSESGIAPVVGILGMTGEYSNFDSSYFLDHH